MFLPSKQSFRGSEMPDIVPFVDYWEANYLTEVGDDHEYFEALNLGNNLTHDNLAELFRWKSHRFHSQKTKAGDSNPRVAKVHEHIDEINAFRQRKLSVENFRKVGSQVFRSGNVLSGFLFHIARPSEWPIGDQHVYRSYSMLFDKPQSNKLTFYFQYGIYFQSMAKELRRLTNTNSAEEALVRCDKRLDRALVKYGQHLEANS